MGTPVASFGLILLLMLHKFIEIMMVIRGFPPLLPLLLTWTLRILRLLVHPQLCGTFLQLMNYLQEQLNGDATFNLIEAGKLELLRGCAFPNCK